MTNVTPDLVRLYAHSDALGLAGLIATAQVSATEIVETAIHVIEALNPRLNAVVIETFDIARATARQPPAGAPFAGVPFLLKDIGSQWQGTRMTAGLGYRSNFVCPADSELARRIKAAGFAMLGRTNVPENGWCIATESKLYGPAINPWNAAVTPGGSSGGAGAAVAARMVPIAEGTDGGGSIRVPASCCGVVGLKPSRGRIPYGPPEVDLWFGSVSFFALTRTVRDAAAYLDATAGNLPGDPYTPPRPQGSWLAAQQEQPKRLKIGYTLAANWGPAFAPEVLRAVQDTVCLLERLGHTLVRYDLCTDLEGAWRSYNEVGAVQTALDFDMLAPVIGRPVQEADLMPFNWSLVQRGRALGGMALAASVGTIRAANRQLQAELTPFDAFLTPTLTQPPRPVGYWDLSEPNFDTYISKWTDAAFMFAFNISGLPSISIPAAWTDSATPIGIQLVGRYGDEATPLHLAAQLEEARPWLDRRPDICAA
jgi:amidase